MENTKDYIITVNPVNNKVTMFVSKLNVSFTVDSQAEYAVLADADIDSNIRGRISLITRMCKNPTFANSVLATGSDSIAFNYSDFMNMITINYANQVNPTIQ